MIKSLLAAALVVAFAGAPAMAAQWVNMNAQIDQTNFVVNQGCSGTLLDLNMRLILTAKHCIDAQYENVEVEKVGHDGVVKKDTIRRLIPGSVRQLRFRDGVELGENVYRTKVISIGTNGDLALLQVVDHLPNTIAAPLACTEPQRGDVAFIVGNPYAILYSSLVKGIISSTDRAYETFKGLVGEGDMQDQPLMQISGGVIGGNSGGAAYNEKGELIGVPVLGSQINEIVGFAVPLSVIKQFLIDARVDGTSAGIELLARCRGPSPPPT